jgi:hypothetical protein
MVLCMHHQVIRSPLADEAEEEDASDGGQVAEEGVQGREAQRQRLRVLAHRVLRRQVQLVLPRDMTSDKNRQTSIPRWNALPQTM